MCRGSSPGRSPTGSSAGWGSGREPSPPSQVTGQARPAWTPARDQPCPQTLTLALSAKGAHCHSPLLCGREVQPPPLPTACEASGKRGWGVSPQALHCQSLWSSLRGWHLVPASGVPPPPVTTGPQRLSAGLALMQVPVLGTRTCALRPLPAQCGQRWTPAQARAQELAGEMGRLGPAPQPSA